MEFPIGSVDAFLSSIRGAKEGQRQTIDENLEPFLADPSTYAVSPAIANLVDDAFEKWGDEAYKQIAMVVLGKWLDVHNGVMQEHTTNQDMSAALFTMADATKITTALRMLSDVGSFGGDDDYRSSMRQEINQAVLENIEETGCTPEEFFYGEK